MCTQIQQLVSLKIKVVAPSVWMELPSCHSIVGGSTPAGVLSHNKTIDVDDNDDKDASEHATVVFLMMATTKTN